MQNSSEQDIQKLGSIIKYLTNIKKCFKQHAIENANNLKNDEIAQAACTQFITNIYEAKKKLRDETYNRLTELNKIKLTGARHIASHDYDNVNFFVIFRICKQLTNEAVLSEIQEVLTDIEFSEKDVIQDGDN